MLVFQPIDKNDFHVFTRDLSERVNVNLKHMIEDFDKQTTSTKKKSKQLKKKDIIIAEQTKKRHEKYIQEDKQKIDFYFKYNKQPTLSELFNFLKSLKTNESKINFKFSLLEKFWSEKPKQMEKLLGLYFELQGKSTNNCQKHLLDKINNKISEYDYNLYMLKHLGHILPPLNVWDQTFQFDDWQKKALSCIKQKQSLIVKAPTSSGKSFIGCSAGVFHKKILYVCPTESVAYQIGSQFIKMNYRVHFLLENVSHFSYEKTCQIFVGTPEYIETFLYKIDTHFDYAVFDEIHDINESYENVVKLIDCNFVALSATIQNIQDIVDFFQTFHQTKQIKTIEYEKRFINTQRWVWNKSTLEKIHPLGCFECIDDIQDVDLKMTPNDIARLWETLEEEFEDVESTNDFLNIEEYIEQMSPDTFFESKQELISLNNVKEYELFLKHKLIELSKDYPQQIKNTMDSFRSNVTHDENIIDFIDCCKKKNMFPMLLFNEQDDVCERIFMDIYETLVKQETENFPHHYDILEKKQEQYLSYMEKRKQFSSNLKPPKQGNSTNYLQSKLDNFDKEYKDKYCLSMMEYYQQLIDKIEQNQQENPNKQIQIDNLNKELTQFLKSPDFHYQDVYQKHASYCYNITEPMSGSKIKDIRKQLSESLGMSIPYEHPLFQMLKRGIGLYIEKSPDIYKRLLQTLLINKDIGIVVSGKSLSMGIDMPIRTSCLCGYDQTTFSASNYLQMSGRAGRRGHDTSGNVVFYNVDYQRLIRSELPKITGSKRELYTHYHVINNIKKIPSEKVFVNFMNKDKQIVKTPEYNGDRNKSIIVWNLRRYKNYKQVIDNLVKDSYNCIIDVQDKAFYIIECVSKLVDSSILESYKHHTYHPKLKECIDIIIVLYNHMKSKQQPLKIIYDKLKHILYKHNGFS